MFVSFVWNDIHWTCAAQIEPISLKASEFYPESFTFLILEPTMILKNGS